MSVAPEEATADMATIARVMTHRFLRQGSQLQSSALAITCGFPTLIYGSVWLSSPETASEMAKSIGPMGFLFFLSELFVVPGLVCVAVVQIRPLHALPISTFKLVNLQLALGVTSACVIHLLTVAYYAAAFNNWLLVLSPMLSLGLMVLVMSGLVVLWLDFRWWRPLLVFGVCMLLPWLASDRVTTSDMEFTWSQRFSLNENEIVVLMSLAAIAYPITLRGARLDRCGELRSWPDIEVWLHRLGQAVIRRLGHRHKAASQVEFTSPASAQLWYEFWGKGWIVPAITLFSCTVSLLSAYESRSGWLSAFPEMAGSIVYAAIFTGFAVGCVQVSSERQPHSMIISQYRSTRPLADAQIAFSVIKAGLASLLLSCLIVAAFYSIVWMWSLIQPDTLIKLPIRPFDISLIGVFPVASWVLLTLPAMLMMTGRIWVVISPFVLMLAGFLLGPLINLALPNIAVDEDKIAEYMMSTLVVLTILATFVAYVFSIRRKIVDSRMIWWGGLASIVTLAVVYIPIAYIVGWNKFSSDWLNDWQVLLSLGLMSLAAAPLAMAPLAIAWNRHR